jgi:hypothetical protein
MYFLYPHKILMQDRSVQNQMTLVLKVFVQQEIEIILFYQDVAHPLLESDGLFLQVIQHARGTLTR